MTFPACPQCKGENTYHDSIQFVCPDCAYEWTGEEVAEADEDQLIVKDSNGNLLADGDDVLLIKDLKLKGSSEIRVLEKSVINDFSGRLATRFFLGSRALIYKITAYNKRSFLIKNLQFCLNWRILRHVFKV